jgi:multidrug resistance efflux pump
MGFIWSVLKSEWKTWLFFLLAGIVFAGFLYVRALRAENAALELAQAVSQQTIESLQANIQASQAALKARQETVNQLAEEKKAAINKLEELYASSQVACQWGDSPIPGDISDFLRQ